MSLDDITLFLTSPQFTGGLLMIKIIFLAFGFIFLGFIILAIVKTTYFKRLIIWDLMEVLTSRAFGVGKFSKKWKKVQKHLESGFESEAKLAIIEADSMLDDVLKEMGYPGESLGERLEKLSTDFLPNLEEVKKIHSIRNNIVHDPYYKLDPSEAKKNLEVYEKALIYLQAL
jgi:uncharacterized protein YutE (UPF0331/DUF86 family)